MTKICSKCSIEKPVEAFQKNQGGLHGRRGNCKSCGNADERAARAENPEAWLGKRREKHAAYMRSWNAKNPDKLAKFNRQTVLRRHGMDENLFNAMLFCQDNACAICRTTKPGGKGRFNVDHDHETGKVRGLLCWPCNIMLGKAKDSRSTLISAASYIEKHAPEARA